MYPTLQQEPDIQIDDATLNSWRHDQLANADTSLTTAIHTSQHPSHHTLASRAFVRARLQQWDAAVEDAEKVPSSLLFFYISTMLIYVTQVNQNPGIRHRIYCKECGAYWQGGKAQSISGVRHGVRPFSTTSL